MHRCDMACMKINVVLSLLLAACFISGCSTTPGSAYARKHPELSPGHRQILVTGIVPGGEVVKGMTKEQVKIAMGGNPTMTRGENVWVYVGKRASKEMPLLTSIHRLPLLIPTPISRQQKISADSTLR